MAIRAIYRSGVSSYLLDTPPVCAFAVPPKSPSMPLTSLKRQDMFRHRRDSHEAL